MCLWITVPKNYTVAYYNWVRTTEIASTLLWWASAGNSFQSEPKTESTALESSQTAMTKEQLKFEGGLSIPYITDRFNLSILLDRSVYSTS